MKKYNYPFNDTVDRRAFMSAITKAVGSVMFLAIPSASSASDRSQANPSWTVGQIMDLFIKEVPGGPIQDTVDTLKAGNRDIKVTGIVTTMFATVDVIQKAIALNANFIIAHEPTFYNHLDDTSWLKNDVVYQHKADLLRKNNIAVWRNHDYIHSLTADGVMAGVVSKLQWGEYFHADNPGVFEMPSFPLRELISQLKVRMGVPAVRYIGNLSQPCAKILLMPGAYGGRGQITAIGKQKPDVIVCGEIAEWETAEYVRDAIAQGQETSLVVLGHVASEEPGSEFLATWLKDKVKGIATTHVPAENSLLFF